MNGRFLLAFVAMVVVGLGAGSGAAALQERMKGGESNDTVAAAARQSGNAGAGGGQSQSATQPGDQQASFGTVENVSAGGFVLVGQGGRMQVATGGATKVSKMADAKVGDLKVGDSIVATGEQQADGTIAAASLQVGAMEAARGMLGGMMGQLGAGAQRAQGQGSGQRSGQQATPPARLQGMMGQRDTAATGTIESIAGDVITVKTQSDSPARVKVTSTTAVRKMAEGSLTDVKAGQTAVVTGERGADGTLAATSIQLIPAGETPFGR